MAESNKHIDNKGALELLLSGDLIDAIKALQLALLRKATDAIDGGNDDPVNGNIDAEQLVAMLMAAVAGQTGTQQSQQQLSQAVGEIVAQLTGRTVTQTTHIADINTPERHKATVARGMDNNELASQRGNNIALNVAEMASVGIGVLLTTTPIVAATLQGQIADQAAKNSDNGRLVQDCVKSGHSHCQPGKTD